MAEPDHTGATNDPTTNPRRETLSASFAISPDVESISVCGDARNKSTPLNLIPSTSAACVRSSIVSRSMGGSESGPLPTSPGHMALCSLGNRFIVSRTEMFQHHQRIGGALISNFDALGGRIRGDEQFVFGHLTEADHGGRRNVM